MRISAFKIPTSQYGNVSNIECVWRTTQFGHQSSGKLVGVFYILCQQRSTGLDSLSSPYLLIDREELAHETCAISHFPTVDHGQLVLVLCSMIVRFGTHTWSL